MLKLACLLRNLIRSMSYYAVAKGRFPGVYFTWPDCKKQVDQFPGAKYRKFSTESEARDFVNKCQDNSTHVTWQDNSTHVTKERDTFAGVVTNQTVQFGNTPRTLSASVSENPVCALSVADKKFHKNEDSGTQSDIQKRLVQLEEKQEEMTKKVRAELEELRENYRTLDSRLTTIETKVLGKGDVDHAAITSKIGEIQKVEKIFEEEFDFLREKINCFKARKNELVVNNDNIESRRQILKNALYEETKPKPLGNRKGGNKSSGKNAGTSGKRKYSTQSGMKESTKVAKLDYITGVAADAPFIVNDEGYVEVYTDGACEKNGRRGAKAGIGVWFGDSHPLNISEPVVGRATNNMAEIQAATYAVETAKKAGVKKLLIHTDSNFLINCITDWIKKWKKNDWHVTGGEPVKNKDELIVLDNKLQGIDVKWNHVRGHHGVHGNEMADLLAREGAKRYVQIECDEDF